MYGDGFETPGCAFHPLHDCLVRMKIETPLAPNEGMEKKGPGRVNCRPLKDINAYAGGSSLFQLCQFSTWMKVWSGAINQRNSFSTNCPIQSACFNKTWVKGNSLRGSFLTGSCRIITFAVWCVEAREMVHSKLSGDYRGACRKQHMKQLSLKEI